MQHLKKTSNWLHLRGWEKVGPDYLQAESQGVLLFDIELETFSHLLYSCLLKSGPRDTFTQSPARRTGPAPDPHYHDQTESSGAPQHTWLKTASDAIFHYQPLAENVSRMRESMHRVGLPALSLSCVVLPISERYSDCGWGHFSSLSSWFHDVR